MTFASLNKLVLPNSFAKKKHDSLGGCEHLGYIGGISEEVILALLCFNLF